MLTCHWWPLTSCRKYESQLPTNSCCSLSIDRSDHAGSYPMIGRIQLTMTLQATCSREWKFPSYHPMFLKLLVFVASVRRWISGPQDLVSWTHGQNSRVVGRPVISVKWDGKSPRIWIERITPWSHSRESTRCWEWMTAIRPSYLSVGVQVSSTLKWEWYRT